MEPTPLRDARAPSRPGERRTFGRALLTIARSAVERAVSTGAPLELDPDTLSTELVRPASSFVTLRRGEALRGCIGDLEAERPLAAGVAANARKAATADPRFAPVTATELSGLRIEVSVLGLLEALAAASETELLSALRPGVDGLVLCDGALRGTFLPAVWESLPAPRDFLAELRRKIGLTADPGSPGLRAYRYSVESFED